MPTYREDFEGKQVELTGQFIPLSTGNPKGDRFQAIRLFITCCAADAKPVGVTVQYDKPLKVSEMGWVKITGIPTFPMEGGRRTAVLVANKVEECPAPAEPFVYELFWHCPSWRRAMRKFLHGVQRNRVGGMSSREIMVRIVNSRPSGGMPQAT